MIGNRYQEKIMILFIMKLIELNLLIYKDNSVIKMYRFLLFKLQIGVYKWNGFGGTLKAWIFILQDKNF